VRSKYCSPTSFLCTSSCQLSEFLLSVCLSPFICCLPLHCFSFSHISPFHTLPLPMMSFVCSNPFHKHGRATKNPLPF
uniref:Uncharacterized protein n=1 Tax=Strix occidentalis caurina TaxID=311401 RepID=A0A8D0FSX1_STROC